MSSLFVHDVTLRISGLLISRNKTPSEKYAWNLLKGFLFLKMINDAQIAKSLVYLQKLHQFILILWNTILCNLITKTVTKFLYSMNVNGDK